MYNVLIQKTVYIRRTYRRGSETKLKMKRNK